jgi:hypothetical protein
MKAHEAVETHRTAHEAAGDEPAAERQLLTRVAAVLVGVLAAFLAIASLLGTREGGQVILSQERATDTYNQYQAESLKQRIGSYDAAILTALNQPAAAAVARQDAAGKGGQKAALLTQARGYEAERDRAARSEQSYQIAEGAFQIGIVLVSIAILARLRPLVATGAALGVIGLLLLLNGLGPGLPVLPA